MSSKEKNLISATAIILAVIGTIFLFGLNVIGLRNSLYSNYDLFFQPFLISARNLSRDFFFTIDELDNRGAVTKENFELRLKINELEELKSENIALKEKISKLEKDSILNVANEADLTLFEIVSPESSNLATPRIILRGGSRNGIEIGQEVRITPNSLLGIITEVYENSAIITPFYSPEFKLNGRKLNLPVFNIESTQNKGLIKEFTENEIRVQSISKDAVVNEGDLWATTNDLADISPNLYIGKTQKVINKDIDGFQEVVISLNYSVSELKFVYIKDVK